MKFVVDTNIAFSAVLNTESKIGDLIMNSHGLLEFHACDTLRSELKKHRLKLLEFSKMSNEQLDQSIYQITACLNFSNEALIPFEFWIKAANLIRNIDMNDIAFVTLAEFLGVKLWTGDVELIKGLDTEKKSGTISDFFLDCSHFFLFLYGSFIYTSRCLVLCMALSLTT